jgi:hypothetical protein
MKRSPLSRLQRLRQAYEAGTLSIGNLERVLASWKLALRGMRVAMREVDRLIRAEGKRK